MSVKVHEAFSIDSARRRYLFEEHFLGDSLRDLWNTEGNAGGSGVVVDAQDGGAVRLTTSGTDNHVWGLNWDDYRSLHVDKKVTIEARVKPDQVAGIQNIIGLFFDGNNRIWFIHNSDVDGNWYIVTVDGGAPTSEDSGVAATDAYHVFRIECFPTGEVHFYIDDVETANSPITTNIPDDAGDYLQPYITVTTRANSGARYLDVDYVVCRQDR